MKLMRQTGPQVYAVILNTLETNEESFGQVSEDPKMMEVVHNYSDVFRTTLPDGLPPKRSVDHQIETHPNEKVPNRRLFKLSPE